LYIDFTHDADYKSKLEELLRELHGSPAVVKPPLGPNPFSGTAPAVLTPRGAGPTGMTGSGESLLDDAWFTENERTAVAGLEKLGFDGSMELRYALHSPVNKSQMELLNAVRRSQIRTFGWPIGIVLDNRAEYKPRPVADGILAEIAIPQAALSGRSSYDYWALATRELFTCCRVYLKMSAIQTRYSSTAESRGSLKRSYLPGTCTTSLHCPQKRR